MNDVTHTLPSHWKYVSEGGATIVFSYRGPPNPTFDGMVLRLRKAANEGAPERDTTNDEEPDDPTIEYQTRCMERLFPQRNLPRLQSVRLERQWLQQLAETHNAERPKSRTVKDHIDFSRRKGVLATDLIGGNWIAVEIKPKWAFLPPATHLSENTKMIKTQTCRFCMHSSMRNQKDQQYVNNYCPLDLFSGNAGGVRQAVDALWDAWSHSNGSVNNLKIFARGKVVKPDQVQHLLHEEVTKSIPPEQIQETFKETLCNTLLQSPVLAILSKLQRTLDVLDIEGLSKLWRQAEIQSPLYQSTFASQLEQPLSSESSPPTTPLGAPSTYLPASEPNISDWVEFLDTYQSAQTAEMDHVNPRIENLRYYLLAYLLSATFKDCSLIVKLDFLRPGDHSEHQVYPVTVIDLDPKSLDRLQRWEELDREIVSNYMLSDRKVCVDGWVGSEAL